MKKLYLGLIVFLIGNAAAAQILSIPDSNFKQKLLRADVDNGIAYDLAGNPLKVDANDNDEIEMNEALQVGILNICCIHQEFIASLEGIANFANLTELDVSHNILTTLNVSGMTSLKKLYCQNNGIAGIQNLVLDNCTAIETLNCGYNSLNVLDVSNCPNLTELNCKVNNLTTLDLSGNTHLDKLYAQGNDLLDLNIQNNSIESNVTLGGNETLEHICADEAQLETVQDYTAQAGLNCMVDASCVLQSEAFSIGGGIALYPNPADAVIKIQSEQKVTQAAIYNTLGQLIWDISAAEINQIDISALSNGIYFLKVLCGSKNYTKKFQKN